LILCIKSGDLMNYIVFDLEFNQKYEEKKEQN